MRRDQIVRAVRDIILRHAKPVRIYLYGSEATGEAGPASDIDIAFEDATGPDLAAIKDDIAALRTLVKVDVTNLTGCTPRFVNRVRSTGRVLYSATRELRAEDGTHNFLNALEGLCAVVNEEAELARAGFADVFPDVAIKRFEFTFEMSWKAIKRYLEFVGVPCGNPRACFMEAYAQGIIRDQALWLDMIDARNLASHVYDEKQIRQVIEGLPRYVEAFEALAHYLRQALPGSAEVGHA
jgi:nucleotidyltransferase substrate binding protein (TIGR01987 family)